MEIAISIITFVLYGACLITLLYFYFKAKRQMREKVEQLYHMVDEHARCIEAKLDECSEKQE